MRLNLLHLFLAAAGATATSQVPFSSATHSISAISAQYTSLSNHVFPKHTVRIKRTDFCDDTVRVFTGYVDIEAKHLFFYFFESRNDPAKDDVILWVNGGPGASASLGLLMELGPCNIDGSNSTKFNPYSWNTNANMIFLDQPVGVGWSYADYGEIVSTTEESAIDVAAFLAILSESFQEFRGRDFHLAGESYGGRYVPLTASAVYDQNKVLESVGMEPINLKSIMIGNGFSEQKLTFASYYDVLCTNASGLGPLQTISTCVRMKQAVPRCMKLMDAHCQPPFDEMNCKYAQAFCDTELSAPFDAIGRNVYNMNVKCYGDISETLCYRETLEITAYLNLPSTRETLGIPSHSPNLTFAPIGQSLYDNFVASNDVIQPSTGYIEALLNRGVKVLIYAGRWDFICNWVANLMMSESLEWDGQEGFSNSELREWKLVGSDDVIGWSKSSGLLHFVVVDGAGHMVPHDQPKVALELLHEWLDGGFGRWA